MDIFTALTVLGWGTINLIQKYSNVSVDPLRPSIEFVFFFFNIVHISQRKRGCLPLVIFLFKDKEYSRTTTLDSPFIVIACRDYLEKDCKLCCCVDA